MKRALCLVVLLSAVLLAGCAVADAILGRDPVTGQQKPGAAPIDLVGTLIPGAAGLAALVRWAYTELRARKVDAAAKAAIAGVTEAVDAANGQPVEKEKLYGALTAASELYANRDFFAELVRRVKDEVRAKRKNGEG
jgi:hypothetical protein